MTSSSAADGRVLYHADRDRRIATVTLDDPARRNSYDLSMRDALARYLDDAAQDDDITVVLLRGSEGVFSTGADMNNAYGWYGSKDDDGGPSPPEEPAEPAAPSHGRPQDVRLLPRLHGLSEGHGR